MGRRAGRVAASDAARVTGLGRCRRVREDCSARVSIWRVIWMWDFLEASGIRGLAFAFFPFTIVGLDVGLSLRRLFV